jgi:hypothetical protein
MKLRSHTSHAVLSAVASIAVLLPAVVLPASAQGQRRDPDPTPIVMCAGQPIPDEYVVVATARSRECPRFYESIANNTFTVVRPRETVTVCSRLTSGIPGYVVTGRARARECPGYVESNEPNITTYQRVARGRWGRDDAPRDEPVALAPLDGAERALMRQLRAAEQRMQLGDPTHQVWTDALAQGHSTSTRLEVQPGEGYAVTVVCDRDCGDVDVRVVSPSAGGDRVLADDRGPEPVGGVRIFPASAEPLEVYVTMQQCAAASCRFAVSVHRAPTTVPVQQRPNAPRPVPPTAPRP